MKDEIKEILDKLRSNDYYEKEYQKSVYYERDLKKLEDYITNLQKENEINVDKYNDLFLYFEDYKSRIEKAIDNINITIEIIKQQPTEDDTWILDRLNGFKYLLQGVGKDE